MAGSVARSTAGSRARLLTALIAGSGMARCYDPRRMSTAPSRTTPSIGGSAGRVARGIGWVALLVVLAASGAGLAGLAWHAPGSAAREELT